MNKFYFFFILNSFLLHAQVNFDNGTILIDKTHYSSNATSIVSSDLNNDGFKEIIVGSYFDNTIMFYKNINGDLQHYQREILFDRRLASYSTFFDISSKDIDNDGLKDIVFISSYEGRIYWFKNLGDYTFSPLKIIAANIKEPKSMAIEDIDNDGDLDIVIALFTGANISLFKNNGDGTFSNQQIIYTVSYGINSVRLKDLDKNGFVDIVSGQDDGTMYWVKNIDGINFSEPIYITGGADDGTAIDFLDINNDTYFDIVFTSNYDNNLKYTLNQEGNSFSSNTVTIDNNIDDPYRLKVVDFDHDNVKDIILSTLSNDKIGWYKNNNDGTFSGFTEITSNVSNPRDFLVDDVNNDGELELLAPSYSVNTNLNKLSIFTKNNLNNTYEENLLNFLFGAANAVKIADLNNDGKNDIISAFSAILWNENLGNTVFSSQKLISPNNKNNFVWDIEVKDLNNDNFLDVVGISDYGLEVYKNNGDGTFLLAHSVPLDFTSIDLEVVDINNDGKLDILLTLLADNNRLNKFINNGNFSFQPKTVIDFPEIGGFRPDNIKSADMDNDGDIDLVLNTSYYSGVDLLRNDGSGNFSYSSVANYISTSPITLADYDKDGYIDIITAGGGSYSPEYLSLIKNLGNGNFSEPNYFDVQGCSSLDMGDINNDGILDIIGTSYQYYSPYDEQIFYYLGNGSSFEKKVIIESLGDAVSYTKNIGLGDLNNDNKLDIVSSYYFINVVKYFLNNSVLSVEDLNNFNNDSFMVFPNPSSHLINWDENLHINRLIVYNTLGQIVLDKFTQENKINLETLGKGVYILKGISDKGIYITKVVKE